MPMSSPQMTRMFGFESGMVWLLRSELAPGPANLLWADPFASLVAGEGRVIG